MKCITFLFLVILFSNIALSQTSSSVMAAIAKKGIIEVGTKKIDVNLSSEEWKLYNLINEYRKSKNLPAVSLSYSLSYVAQQHCLDLEKNRPSSADTCNLHSWSDKGKWTSVCYTPDHKKADKIYSKPGELTNYSGNGYEVAYYHSGGATAVLALTGWKNSPGHNKMLLNTGMWGSNWKSIGIGIYKNYATVWLGHEEDIHSGDALKKF